MLWVGRKVKGRIYYCQVQVSKQGNVANREQQHNLKLKQKKKGEPRNQMASETGYSWIQWLFSFRVSFSVISRCTSSLEFVTNFCILSTKSFLLLVCNWLGVGFLTKVMRILVNNHWFMLHFLQPLVNSHLNFFPQIWDIIPLSVY